MQPAGAEGTPLALGRAGAASKAPAKGEPSVQRGDGIAAEGGFPSRVRTSRIEEPAAKIDAGAYQENPPLPPPNSLRGNVRSENERAPAARRSVRSAP